MSEKVYTDIIKQLSESMICNNLSEESVDLIIREYVNLKKESLLKGKVVNEEGLASYKLISRGSDKTDNSRSCFTIKVSSTIDKELKESLLEKIKSKDDFDNIINSGVTVTNEVEGEDE